MRKNKSRTGMLIRWLPLALVAFAVPSRANIYVELSFQQKMAGSDLVIIGTVTSTTRANPGRRDGTATVTPLATLKGSVREQIIVRRQDVIVEADPQCCEVGATYVMFLRQTPNGELVSVNGRFGMIRIGPLRSDPEIEVIDSPSS